MLEIAPKSIPTQIATAPFRGYSTFLRMPDYPYAQWKTKRRRGERVVELAIDYAVFDIEKYTKRVIRMKSTEELDLIFEA